ncbi:hypothetical protein Taro_001412 [Colocasia esculenta]|uniref:FCP1 homology domain-containing protein n=1 Tax=Colocasia esculenta TaxID=4460 RepID=A0A843THT3_COLES|nr:hypothetical protein [Colocasia esculenta]
MRKKHSDENFKVPLPTGVQVIENVLDKGPNLSLQVVDENRNLQTGNTADIKRQRNLSHSSEAESEGFKLITYSRRSSKAGHMRKKKNQNTSQENLQKNVSHNKNSSIVKPAETGFWRKKNNDASFGESSLGVDGKEDGPMREGRQADRASTVSTDSDPKKANFLDSTTNKHTRRRRRKNKTSSNARQVSVSEQRVSVSKESENIDSVKNGDLHHEILSKSDMAKENNINQRMSVKQDSSDVRVNSTIIAVKETDQHRSPRHSVKTPVFKYTYSKRFKNSGQREKGPHKSSYLNSQDNKNDLCNGSSSILDATEADCKRVENDNASFNASPLLAKKDGGSSMNTQTSPTSLNHSDINSNFHEVNKMDLDRIKKPRTRRGRKKKNKTPICTNQLPVSEKDMSVCVKSEIIEVEKSGMDSEICSKSEIGNVESNSGRTYIKRKNRAKKEMEMVTANKNGSLDSAQLCTPKMLKPKNEDLCQWKGEILIGEMSNGKDGERCPHSSVQGVTDDIMLDTTTNESITFDNMAMPLQRPLINDGKKKLLILDLNGLLVDVLYERHPFRRPPIRVSGKSVYKRPFCERFLDFCFERFNVGVWSSRQRKNIDVVVNFLFGEKRSRLLFVWVSDSFVFKSHWEDQRAAGCIAPCEEGKTSEELGVVCPL